MRPPGGQHGPQERPGRPQERPKSAQDDPRSRQERPKSAPRAARSAPGRLQEGPGADPRPQEDPGVSQGASGRPPEAQIRGPPRPKITRKCCSKSLSKTSFETAAGQTHETSLGSVAGCGGAAPLEIRPLSP